MRHQSLQALTQTPVVCSPVQISKSNDSVMTLGGFNVLLFVATLLTRSLAALDSLYT